MVLVSLIHNLFSEISQNPPAYQLWSTTLFFYPLFAWLTVPSIDLFLSLKFLGDFGLPGNQTQNILLIVRRQLDLDCTKITCSKSSEHFTSIRWNTFVEAVGKRDEGSIKRNQKILFTRATMYKMRGACSLAPRRHSAELPASTADLLLKT